MNAANDILIVGGGIIGLAIAVELQRRGAKVTVISRNSDEAATYAAAGMIAPQAESIPPSPLLDLCLESRALYPEWVRKLEDLTGIETGYLPCGILAPVYEPPTVHPPSKTSIWLDINALGHYQPGLGEDVVGGWWYPEDAQVDNRALAQALRQAAQSLGVEWREGVHVEALQRQQGRVVSLRTCAGEFQANQYILASGAWMSELLPLPVRPLKGQMLSVRMPQAPQQPLPLQRVLFGPETYLVPRRDGRLIVGATVEDVGWSMGNTPAGMGKLIGRAKRLYPALEDWKIEQMWWGFRPTTPDKLPILGVSECENLFVATGHHRNGILLAPVTAMVLADLIDKGKVHPLLEHFRSDRFYRNSNQLSGLPPAKQPSQHVEIDNGQEKMAQVNGSQTSSTSQFSPEDLAVSKPLVIAGRKFQSRLMTGTGKYCDLEVMRQSIAASGSQIVTVAVRRVQAKAPGHEGLAEALDWSQLWMLPNTAGCKTGEEAVRVARLGREMAKLLGQEDNNFVKLEVIPDPKYLLPDPIGTLQAAEQLVKEGFAVLPYINADPILAKRLEEVGCVTVMPLGSPIGSGQGIKNTANIQIIIEESNVPVVVDAGIGAPSEAAQAMELGADALLINSAIALAKNPVAMARAMGLATEAGYLARRSGRIPIKSYASASSPLTGTISS